MINIELITPQMIPLTKIELNKGQVEGVPQNPRFIRDERYNKLKESITKHPEMMGYRELWVFPHNGKYVIIGGNQRFRALKDLGYKEAPCKVLPEDTPAEDLRQFILLDNAEFGENDTDILVNEFETEDLELAGIDLTFDVEDEPEDTSQVADDDFDEDKEDIPTRTKLGDVWQLGDHRLMCGDSTSAEDVKKLMGGELADLWLTDPPYNVAYEGATEDKLTIMNDSMSDADFRSFLVNAYTCAFDNIKEGASFYIWHADSEGFNFRGALHDVGQKCRQCLIWNKNAMVMGRQDYQWKHEPCLYGWKEGASHRWFSDRKQTTILEFDKPTRSAEHPTMKPIPLFAYQISNSSQKGDIVLDTFGGSGTTMIACEQLNRKARLMELDPHYCDVIIARWEKLTGETAVKV